jgi:GNAT superfamily N-acetyltransferase
MSGDYRIRPATLSDREAVTAVLSRSYPALLSSHYEPAVLASALPMMTRANPRLLSSGTYHVACDVAGNLLGCGGWTPDHPGTGEIKAGLGHLRHFAVDPSATRKGIGARLLAHCIAEAEARGIRTIECYATLSAEAFYRSGGFVIVRRIDVDMGGTPFPSLLMKRTPGC